MKKIILFFICLFFVYSVYGLEIRTNAIIKGVNKKAGFETCFVKDMFYTKQNELFIKATKKVIKDSAKIDDPFYKASADWCVKCLERLAK